MTDGIIENATFQYFGYCLHWFDQGHAFTFSGNICLEKRGFKISDENAAFSFGQIQKTDIYTLGEDTHSYPGRIHAFIS